MTMRTWTGRSLLLIAAFVIAAMSPTDAQAVTILRYSEFDLGTSATPGALASLGLTGSTTTVTTTAAFNAAIASSPDLVIVEHHNFGDTDGEILASLTTYLSSGGCALVSTWETDLAPLMEASDAGVNATSITTDAHPIFAGLGATILLDNPGWGVFSRSWDPTGTAIGLGTLGGGSAVILGNDGRSLLQGPLFDTFDSLAQGEQFVANEIDFLLSMKVAAPEPATASLALLGLGGLVMRRRNRAA